MSPAHFVPSEQCRTTGTIGAHARAVDRRHHGHTGGSQRHVGDGARGDAFFCREGRGDVPPAGSQCRLPSLANAPPPRLVGWTPQLQGCSAPLEARYGPLSLPAGGRGAALASGKGAGVSFPNKHRWRAWESKEQNLARGVPPEQMRDGARCGTLMRWVGASVARLELSHFSPSQAERMYFTHMPTNPPPVSPCTLSHHCLPMAASRARLRAILCHATCYANKLALPPST